MTDRRQLSADDEALSALVDGELDADEARRLRERLAREPDLAARLERFERADAKLRGAYAGIVDEPLPRGVVELLQSGSADDAAPAGSDAAVASAAGLTGAADNVVELRRRGIPSWFSLPAAAAAAVALTIGVLVGTMLDAGGPQPAGPGLVAGPVEPGTALHDVLEATPSGATLELAPGVTAAPVLTFRTRAGDYCRQVDVASAAGTAEALACRRGATWRLELAAFTAASGGAGVYRPAGGDTPVRAAVDSMIEGAPLESNAERELMAEGWMRRR